MHSRIHDVQCFVHAWLQVWEQNAKQMSSWFCPHRALGVSFVAKQPHFVATLVRFMMRSRTVQAPWLRMSDITDIHDLIPHDLKGPCATSLLTLLTRPKSVCEEIRLDLIWIAVGLQSPGLASAAGRWLPAHRVFPLYPTLWLRKGRVDLCRQFLPGGGTQSELRVLMLRATAMGD